MKNKNISRLMILLTTIFTIVIAVYTILATRGFFLDKNLWQLEPQIKIFGIWEPLVIFGLISLCIIIPPFPLPIPILEMIAGALFGFVPGVILVWLSQFVPSLVAYGLTKYVPKSYLEKAIGSKFYKPYIKFIERRGESAVFIIRATTIASFSVSYLAGLSKLNFKGFTIATALGLLPEALIFVYGGTLVMRYQGIQFWYIFIIFVVIVTLPVLVWLLGRLFFE